MAEALPHPVTGTPYPSPVPPGTGWPDDPATAETPVARSAAAVRRLAAGADLSEVDARVSVCRACPRLVRWREDVARDKRASFADQPYWGRPIAGWGTPTHGVGDEARVLVVGLATRTTSVHAGDGQALVGTRMVATVRCAPPANQPTVTERDTCEPWIDREVALLAPTLRVVVALGGYGWAGALRALAGAGYVVPRPRPRFGHGARVALEREGRAVLLLGCYHPSQHNTFTGRLTPAMLDDVLGTARDLAGL